MGPSFYPIPGYSGAMPARTLPVAGGLMLALVLPAGAQAAPVLEPLKPCYVTAGTAKKPQGEPVRVAAAGFTPGSRVTLAVDGVPHATQLQVDMNGRLEHLGEFPAPFVKDGTRDSILTLTENDNPANTVSAPLKSAALDVSVKPRIARPAQRIRFSGLGFTADKPVWAHYTYRGKQKARVRVVRRTGECGAWSARRPQFPMRTPRQGRWTVQFDQSKRYIRGGSKRLKSVYVLLDFRILLEPR